MVIDKSHCLIFISRIFSPSETARHILPKFKKSNWDALDVEDGVTLNQYFRSDELSTSILKINGNRYFYANNERFWEAFAKQNGEPSHEEHKESFWFFKKIEDFVQQLQDVFNIEPQTIHIFIHWGGGGYDVKHKKIQSYYQSYQQDNEVTSPYQFHFYHFSRKKTQAESISWSIYNESNPNELLQKLQGILVMKDAPSSSDEESSISAKDRFVQFEMQLFEDENYLEEDQKKPRGFDYLIEQGAIDKNGSTDIFPEV